MKPPQRTEAERIAGTLTKAQRVAVLTAKPHGRNTRTGEDCSFYVSARSSTVHSLVNLALAYRWGKVSASLTEPLGLAVREILLSQEQTDER